MFKLENVTLKDILRGIGVVCLAILTIVALPLIFLIGGLFDIKNAPTDVWQAQRGCAHGCRCQFGGCKELPELPDGL